MMFSVLFIVLMIIMPAMVPMLLAVALMALGLVLCAKRGLAVVARAAELSLVHRSHVHRSSALLHAEQPRMAVIADVALLRMLLA